MSSPSPPALKLMKFSRTLQIEALPEPTETHVRRVSDAIQPSHPLSTGILSPPLALFVFIPLHLLITKHISHIMPEVFFNHVDFVFKMWGYFSLQIVHILMFYANLRSPLDREAWHAGVHGLCPTLCNPMDCNLSGSCVQRISQARILEWVVHPKFHYKQAHDPGTDTSCVTFSYDGTVLASRGGDDTLKLWDIRQFNKPLFSASGLPTMFPMTDCCFSPDDKLVVTGTSVQRGCGSGKLVFFERRTFQRVYEIDITDAVSKLCVVKTQRKAKQAETLTQDYIITPHALPMFREPRQRSTRKQLEKDRLDPLKSHKPEPPVAGPGRGGRVGTHGGTLSSYIVKNIALDKTDDSNPREAILRHAKAAEDNPYWVSPAYSNSQESDMTEHSHKPILGVPWWLTSPPANVGDVGLIPGGGDLLEEEMATHFSLLAWEIPWTEEPGGLQPTGLQESQT
ncbi:hypothetical protein FD755_018838 [Muntiacus reevesi]|uniref:WD repeat-containing protein 70 n=1 Tax=Muntiacus reevesi TaxID=9886 RepID=A0A5N3X7Z5_MUNRE|nr:hypothetical protein FD755_018838 [Muntiacus reevesi]